MPQDKRLERLLPFDSVKENRGQRALPVPRGCHTFHRPRGQGGCSPAQPPVRKPASGHFQGKVPRSFSYVCVYEPSIMLKLLPFSLGSCLF